VPTRVKLLNTLSIGAITSCISLNAYAQSTVTQSWQDVAIIGQQLAKTQLADTKSANQSTEDRFENINADIVSHDPLSFDTYSDITPISILSSTPATQVLTNSVFGVSAISAYQTAGPISGQKKSIQPRHRTLAPDRWQGLNRFIFNLNDKSDKLVIKPLAKGYRKVTTRKMRKALRNFLSNLSTPTTLINDVLQGSFDRALTTSRRFIINSAIGFGGIADPATKLGLPRHTEDFGQTLAVWGVPSGPYVVLPFFGPSTVRDSFGLAIDRTLFSPLNYFQIGAVQKARFSRTGATLLAQREPFIEPLEDIERNSLDFYSSFRSFYLQARRREILNGQTNINDLPDIGDGFDEFDEFDELE